MSRAAEDFLLDTEDYENPLADHAELIKQFAREFATFGDFMEVDEVEVQAKKRVSFNQHVSYALKEVFNVLDTILEYLEQLSAKDEDSSNDEDSSKKKERLSRGLYHIVGNVKINLWNVTVTCSDTIYFSKLGLGSFTSSIGLLEILCKAFDIPKNLYRAKQDHISECLKAVKSQEQELSKLVGSAAQILNSVFKETKFDHTKALQFDNVVKQANNVIESCEENLDTAMKTIEELTTKMTIFKWCSRGLFFTGWGLACYGIYHFTPSWGLDTLASYVPTSRLKLIEKICLDSKFSIASKATACAVSCYICMSWFPRHNYSTFHNSLGDLRNRHFRLTNKLKHLKKKLTTDEIDFGNLKP